MSNLQDLVARLRLDTTQFNKGMRGVGATMKKVGTALAAAGAGMAAAALAATKSAADMGDAIDNASKAAGMGVTAYQEYAFALGEVADISREEVDAALVRLNRTIGEAAEGSKAAAGALEKLGFSTDQIASGSVTTEQALAAFVTKVEAMKNPAEAAALATDLFGKAGARMGGIMAGQAGAVDGFIDRARALGIVVSEDFVKESATFNDKMAELGKQFEALKVKIADRLLPIFNDVLIPALQDYVIPAFEYLALKIADGIEVIGNLAAAWRQWADDFKATVGGAIDWVSGKFDAIISKVEAIIAKIGEWVGALKSAVSISDEELSRMEAQNAADRAVWSPEAIARGTPDVPGGGGYSIGSDTADGMINGFRDGVARRKPELDEMIDAIPKAARERLQIHSPSQVFHEIGANIGQGMANGVLASIGLTQQAVRTMSGSAVEAADATTSQVLSAMGNLFQGSKKIAAGIALANSWLAFTEVLKDPAYVGRPWARFAAASGALSAGLNAVRNIKSASAGGGGTGATGSAAAAEVPTQNVTIQWNGPSSAFQSVQELFAMVNKAADQGYRFKATVVQGQG